MKKSLYILQFLAIMLFLLTQNSSMLAQTNCTEADLRSKRVSMLSCNNDSDNCSVDPNTSEIVGNDSAIKAFARSPLDSSWGVSDTAAEQWFLKQASARRAINKYGINENNIGGITSTIKSAGVSVVFFYAYTVNEGGGAGGYINHFKSGDGGLNGEMINDARIDSEYLARQSKIMDSTPSWVDAGNKVYFVPQDVQNAGNADFQSMPSGTIGRAYIPATAAATWEVYYPDGLKEEFNKVQNYGHPLADTMSNIIKMGGNPEQSNAVATEGNNCTGTVGITGEGIAKAVNWAKTIANNDGYGYDQSTRTSGWQKWKSDPNCVSGCGNFDCSSFIAGALTEAGYFTTNPQFSTQNMVSVLSQKGFTKIADSITNVADLRPGDILIRTGHTAMYIGDNQIAHASINENGGSKGGQVGDQTGKEVKINSLSEKNWNLGVWRAPN